MDDYKPYIQDQWHRGLQQTQALFHEIQQQGYPGSYLTLARYTHQLRPLPAYKNPIQNRSTPYRDEDLLLLSPRLLKSL